MRNRNLLTGILAVALALMSGCAGIHNGSLSVQGGDPIIYRCENRDLITARYYSLSDRSLHFVKIVMPDNKVYTLPQAASASGVRYSNDLELVWWTKGPSALLQMRDQEGVWQTVYHTCQQWNE